VRLAILPRLTRASFNCQNEPKWKKRGEFNARADSPQHGPSAEDATGDLAEQSQTEHNDFDTRIRRRTGGGAQRFWQNKAERDIVLHCFFIVSHCSCAGGFSQACARPCIEIGAHFPL